MHWKGKFRDRVMHAAKRGSHYKAAETLLKTCPDRTCDLHGHKPQAGSYAGWIQALESFQRLSGRIQDFQVNLRLLNEFRMFLGLFT